MDDAEEIGLPGDERHAAAKISETCNSERVRRNRPCEGHTAQSTVVVVVEESRSDWGVIRGERTNEGLRIVIRIQTGKVENIGTGYGSDRKRAAILFNEIPTAGGRLSGGRRFVDHQTITAGGQSNAEVDGRLSEQQGQCAATIGIHGVAATGHLNSQVGCSV